MSNKQKMEQLPLVKLASKKLENDLKDLDYGTFVSFDEMIEMANGIDIKVEYRYIIATVKRALRNHHSRVLISVRGQGYVVGQPAHIIDDSSKKRKGIFRAAKNSVKNLQTIDMRNLNDVEKVSLLNEQAKNAILIVCHKATENKALKDERLVLNALTEADIMKQILNKTNEEE